MLKGPPLLCSLHFNQRSAAKRNAALPNFAREGKGSTQTATGKASLKFHLKAVLRSLKQTGISTLGRAIPHLQPDLRRLEAEALIPYTIHLKTTHVVALQSWNFPKKQLFPVLHTVL